VVEPVAATRTSWAYEARRDYLERKLRFVPYVSDSLIAQGLWTGTIDAEGHPIPSEVAFRSGLWQREVAPVYNSPEPTLNKMRSLRDTLITHPECGPRLISAGLWTGERDDEGMPIPAPASPERNRR
jgi:hypothetical protein